MQNRVWQHVADYGPYKLWAGTQAGETIYVARSESEGVPSPTSGGYFTIAAALQVKNIRRPHEGGADPVFNPEYEPGIGNWNRKALSRMSRNPNTRAFSSRT